LKVVKILIPASGRACATGPEFNPQHQKKKKKKNRKTNNNKTMKKNLIPSRIPRMGRESGVAVLWSLSLLP
jgi:hypothetical protein